METFDPAKYSLAENAFFLKHMGESPLAVLQSPLPTGVTRHAVEAALGRVYELAQLKEHRGTHWVGVEKVSEAISRYLIEREKWTEFTSQGAPTFPSMFAWDGKGKPHRGGIGSDAGQVLTYFVDGGKRKPFAVPLVEVSVEAFSAPWQAAAEEPIPDACVEDAEKGVMSCPVDGFSTNWNPDSRKAYNLARARMARHCKSSKNPRVQEFGLKVFGR